MASWRYGFGRARRDANRTACGVGLETLVYVGQDERIFEKKKIIKRNRRKAADVYSPVVREASGRRPQ